MFTIAKEWTIPTRGAGLPDYSVAAPIGQAGRDGLYTTSDQAELAARLGAYNSIDRRGNVVCHDNFESGIESWVPMLGAGAGANCEWSPESFRNGGFSLKLSSGLLTTSTVQRSWGVKEPNKAGYEFSFAVQFYDTLAGLNYYNDNTNVYFTAWYLDGPSLLLYTYNDPPLVEIIDDVELYWDYHSYSSIKLVWDTQTGKYVRILVNQLEMDISQYTVPFLPAPGTGRYMVGAFSIAGLGGLNHHVYIDDFIATINEPNNT